MKTVPEYLIGYIKEIAFYILLKTPDPNEETTCYIYRHGMKIPRKFMVIFAGSAVNQIRNP
jgi:hypothetical protein